MIIRGHLLIIEGGHFDGNHVDELEPEFISMISSVLVKQSNAFNQMLLIELGILRSYRLKISKAFFQNWRHWAICLDCRSARLESVRLVIIWNIICAYSGPHSLSLPKILIALLVVEVGLVVGRVLIHHIIIRIDHLRNREDSIGSIGNQ